MLTSSASWTSYLILSPCIHFLIVAKIHSSSPPLPTPLSLMLISPLEPVRPPPPAPVAVVLGGGLAATLRPGCKGN